MKYRRIFIIVMDSVGVGYDSKSYLFDDEGANTLFHIGEKSGPINIPTLNALGINDICNVNGTYQVSHPHSFTMKLNEISNGKDTLTGHWEMMGINTSKPFKTFTENGFPKELIEELENKTGHKVIGNVAASGTEIIKELGERQMKENSLIVYTSTDSVLQIAAHESVTGLEELYRVCEIARNICMKEEWKVARIIARPFLGDNASNFKRTPNRHDYALRPSNETVMNILKEHNYEVSCVGKINDIFDGYGVTKTIKTISNNDGMDKVINYVKNDNFTGICFINLVEFDSEYGHRRDVIGYKNALEEFDMKLNELLPLLKEDDLLMITADHGNDPTWKGTDHTREKVPLIIYSNKINNGLHLFERESFADIGATVLHNFDLSKPEELLGKYIKEVF